jgi:hypothetical protein
VPDAVLGRPAAIVGRSASGPGIIRGAPRESGWERALPAAEFAHERSVAERKGIDPCNTADDGWGDFEPWIPIDKRVHFTLPRAAQSTQRSWDVVIHFHGDELARKEFVRAKVPMILIGLSASPSTYSSLLSGPTGLKLLLESFQQRFTQRLGSPVTIRHLALTAWSGGYEAIALLLQQSNTNAVDAVVLLDGLHGSRDPKILTQQLEPVRRYAERAVRGDAFMFVSHSSIDPGSYASTTETAHSLIASFGAAPLSVRREDPAGLLLIEQFDSGGFHVRGYAGGGKFDHCAHLSLLPDVLHALSDRWAADPEGRR